MTAVQVILREDVPNVGKTGEIVRVKPGFARNYLIPQDLAVLATSKNVARIEHDRTQIAAEKAKARKDSESLGERLAAASVTIQKNVGAEDKLFGSVTAKEIEAALALEGIRLDRKRIQLAEPIRSLGVHEVSVKLGNDVSAVVKVWVVAKK
ncbi:MAG: 50S ribosomal protein L9 [Deltaproteobacteria bacterium]|nr:50S ribosomal protein L9 [Deltaproteobacteria bacterium]